MVTVLDTYGFWKEFDAGESLPGGGESAADRPLADVLVEGIEFCDVLVMNKTDMVPDDVLDEIESVADRLGPRARRIRTSYSEVDPNEVLDTGLFDFAEAKRSSGWKRAIVESEGESDDHAATEGGRGHGGQDHDHAEGAAAAHGVDSFVYRSTEALDPERFADWLDDWHGDVIRAKGVANVAGTDEVIGVSQAGPSVQAGPIGEWGPDDDRRTRLVFIGSEMDEPRIRRELDELAAADPSAASAAEAFPI
jgi:G3E family GTPase